MFGFGKKKAKKQEEEAKEAQKEEAQLDPRQQGLFSEPGQEAAPEGQAAPLQPKKINKLDKLVMGAIVGAAVGSVIGMSVTPKKASTPAKNPFFSALKSVLFSGEAKKLSPKSPNKNTQNSTPLKKIPNEVD